MSLKNEVPSALESTKNFYKEYTSGMTRERLGKDFHADSDRLKQLYREAIGEDTSREPPHEIPVHIKIIRLFNTITSRLNPVRRLFFGSSIIAFFLSHFMTGILADILLPLSYIALIVLLMIEQLEKMDVKKEIDLAREIQLSLLPASSYKSKYLEIESFAHTAHEVGGDYVDTIETPNGTYVIIADVSGKGLSAALYMVRLQALVHLLLEKNELPPKQLLTELNDYVKSDTKDKTFVTACAAYFPKDEPWFTFARAGHNPPIYYNKEKDGIYQLKTEGFALGMTSTSMLEKQLVEKQIQFDTGDSIFFYTDGLTEARNERGDEFGLRQIESIMELYGSLHAETLLRKVQNSLELFVADTATFDDITFTCIHRPVATNKKTAN